MLWQCRSNTPRHARLSIVHCDTAAQADEQTSPWWTAARGPRPRARGAAKTVDRGAARLRRCAGDGDDASKTRQTAPLSSSRDGADDDRAARDHTSIAPVSQSTNRFSNMTNAQ